MTERRFDWTGDFDSHDGIMKIIHDWLRYNWKEMQHQKIHIVIESGYKKVEN